jgi:hypothetical protein
VREQFVRPNGRFYRPRREGLWARAWSNEPDGDQGCIVFGTLRPELAEQLAREVCGYWYGDADTFDVAEPGAGWWRDGYGYAGRQWSDDPERGTPGVMFTWKERSL